MKMIPSRFFRRRTALLALMASAVCAPVFSAAGDTRVARWKNDRKAAFMMMFDDCCPTHATNVYPELDRRGMTGTFYIVGNKPERLARLDFWEKQAPASPHVVFGNHTMDHRAFQDVASAEKDIVGCSELIMRLVPGKNPRLLSFATPGGAKHLVSETQIGEIAARNHLVVRPAFAGHGAGVHFRSAADVLRALDKAVAAGGVEYVIFHGVGGDWLSFDGREFIALLDGLEPRRGDLWITDPVSLHKYQTERATASVKILKSGPGELRLSLDCDADTALYDQPLTLATQVDPSWKKCRATQGGRSAVFDAVAGVVLHEAIPGAGEIVLSPAG